MKITISNKENDLLRILLENKIMESRLMETTLKDEVRQNCLNNINFMNILLNKLRNNIEDETN